MKTTTYQGKGLRMANALRESVRVSTTHYGTIRHMAREGKSAVEIMEALGIEMSPQGFVNHVKKNMRLNVRIGTSTRLAHKGDETTLPHNHGQVNMKSYRPMYKKGFTE